MLKKLIALTAASSALALAASLHARIPTVQIRAEVAPNGIFAVTLSNVLTSCVTNGVSLHFGKNLTQVRKSNPPGDDYIAYRHVFAHIYFGAHRKEKPHPEVNPAVDFYKNSVPLSEAEASVLAKIALESETRILAIEEDAATIIKRFRERIASELKSGRKPSAEPPELQTLQRQRVRTTLQCRDELRKAFGEPTFSRFDNFLKEGLNLRIEKASPSPQNN